MNLFLADDAPFPTIDLPVFVGSGGHGVVYEYWDLVGQFFIDGAAVLLAVLFVYCVGVRLFRKLVGNLGRSVVKRAIVGALIVGGLSGVASAQTQVQLVDSSDFEIGTDIHALIGDIDAVVGTYQLQFGSVIQEAQKTRVDVAGLYTEMNWLIGLLVFSFAWGPLYNLITRERSEHVRNVA